MNTVQYLAGGIVSLDPLITYSRRAQGAPVGLASVYPELFRGKRALHFIGFASSAEFKWAASLPADLARIRADLPDNRFVMLANSDYEFHLLSTAGVPTISGSNLIFIDESIYRPLEPAANLPAFDAVYNARFDPFKRHELAAKIDSLMLIYDYADDKTGETESRVRELLPRAWCAQHELNGGRYVKSDPATVARLLNQCRVGLCLSAGEGAMRASMEYLLCGLMVVTTPSLGGRDRYLMAPYSRFAPPDADAIARAVKAMVEAPIPKQAVRNYIGGILQFERHNFLLTANRIAHKNFGREAFSTIKPFQQFGNIWRPAAELIAPLMAQ